MNEGWNCGLICSHNKKPPSRRIGTVIKIIPVPLSRGRQVKKAGEFLEFRIPNLINEHPTR